MRQTVVLLERQEGKKTAIIRPLPPLSNSLDIAYIEEIRIESEDRRLFVILRKKEVKE